MQRNKTGIGTVIAITLLGGLFLGCKSTTTNDIVVTGLIDISVTTASYSGDYAPANCFVGWVTDDQDNFVQTLRVAAKERKSDLRVWGQMTSQDVVDAVTSATRKSHGEITMAIESPLPDGDYKLWMEITESSAGVSSSTWGGKTSFAFTILGTTAISINPPDVMYMNHSIFKDIQMVSNY